MSRKTLALASITALALSANAHAQVVYNWTLTTSGDANPGNGSGTLVLTGNVVTSMNGTLLGAPVSLTTPGQTMFASDYQLPLTGSGLSFTVGQYGDFAIMEFFGNTLWSNTTDGGPATFTYTPVPEPSTWAMGGVFGLAAVVTAAARRRQRVAKA